MSERIVRNASASLARILINETWIYRELLVTQRKVPLLSDAFTKTIIFIYFASLRVEKFILKLLVLFLLNA